MDEIVNSQGRELLKMADDHDLRFLNGDIRFGSGSWGWTFSETRKNSRIGVETKCRSVIDYVVADMAACAMVREFEVGLLGPWSDHAPLILEMVVPDLPPIANPGNAHIRERRRVAEQSTAYLDVLLRETLEMKRSLEDQQKHFYGPILDDCKESAIKVYTDGSCLNNGTTNAAAGAGIYFGESSRFNTSLRVTGADKQQG
jgi:hypothetical protein